MCLAVPLRLVSVNGTDAVGEVGGIQREVSIMMTPDVKVGDYVIVHAGFAIQVLDQKEAEENLELLRQIGETAEAMQEEARSRLAKTRGEEDAETRRRGDSARRKAGRSD
jgi:hydrogenase expression/formation protein HypC